MQKACVLADEFLAANPNIPSFALACGYSRHGLAGHAKLEWDVSLNSTKKIRNIRSFGLAVKNISLFTYDVL
jgi:hypothetical protein